jgi:hypothetical protein
MMITGELNEQFGRELVEQLNNARYASLTSRAVTDAARGVVDRLIEHIEGGEEYRKSRKYKRSQKARYALRRAMEGFVGDLLRAYEDEKSGGWIYRSKKSGSFSGDGVSYRNFLTVLKSIGNFVETRTGFQERFNGFDPGGPSLPIRGKATRYRATPLFIEFCSSYGIDVRQIKDHFIQDLPRRPLALSLSEHFTARRGSVGTIPRCARPCASSASLGHQPLRKTRQRVPLSH